MQIGLIYIFQIAARCLNIPTDRIYINNSSSDKVPNAIPTAASVSSDIYGMAVIVSILFVQISLTKLKMSVN